MNESMSTLKRRYIKISFLAVIVLIVLFFYYDNREERLFFNENYILLGGSLSNDSVCHLPLNINPFDESVGKYITILPNSIECKYQNDPKNKLTFIDESGVLRQSVGHYKCKYQFFDRVKDNDNVVDYKTWEQLNPKTGVSMDGHSFVAVECRDLASRPVYQNTHFWYPLAKNPKTADDSQQSPTKPSVLILVIESLSRVNYLRFMNKTRHSLEKLGNIVYMKGLTKLADNSFPNMVPFLTGKRVWNNELTNEDFGPYDDWPFIWKDFSKAGYKTALIEDFPTFTLFNYESKGFTKQPTDWYPRPFWIHLFRGVSKILLELVPFDLSNCYIDRFPKIDIFLDQIKHFIGQSESNHFPYFAFTFYIEVTHNDFNRAQLIDSHVSQFFEQMNHRLNNTIVILMGDHGNRFGPVLQTVIGRIEERMPLFAVRIPDQLNKQFPELVPTLASNSERLMTWLDLHLMLDDISKQNYSPLTTEPKTSRAFSPWRQSIPDERTCADALIPDNFCVCNKRKSLNVSEPLVTTASLALIGRINSFLPLDKCQHLSLNASLAAELILPSSSTAKPKGFESRIEITISAEPSKAIFRAQLFRTAHSQDWTVRGDISRINKYGNQSKCVPKRQLKPFCYCFTSN